MDTKKFTGFDTTGMAVDPIEDDVRHGQSVIDQLLGPGRDLPMSASTKEIRRDSDGMENVRRGWHGLPPVDRPTGDAFKAQFLCEWSREPMNLASPYGEGNHYRISWRRNWNVDREALTATHTPTGFALAFTPCPAGGYTARLGCELPPFGPDGTLAMAQMFGLRELLKDGWEIFHTVMRKR